MFENVREDIRYARRVNTRSWWGTFSDPGTQAVIVYRFCHWASNVRLPILRQLLALIYFPLQAVHQLLSGVFIATKAEFGPGFVIHGWVGVFLPACKYGHHVIVEQGVLLNWGCRGVGDEARFGPGCKIVKPVRIGNRSKIGANSVVYRDVPDDCTVIGNPARVILFGPDWKAAKKKAAEKKQ